MNTEQSKNVDDFEKLLAIWKEAYRWKISSYLVVKTPAGPRLLFGRILLETVITPHTNLPSQVETKHIIAGQEIIKTMPADIDADIGRAKNGEMTVSARTFSLTQSESLPFSIIFSPIYHPLLTFGPRLPTITVRGGSKHNLSSMLDYKPYELLDWELKALDQPFDTLDELSSYLGLPTLLQMGDSTTLEIAARSPAMISDTSKIDAQQASIKCHAAVAIDVKKIKLGYKIFHKDSTDRSSVIGDKIKWEIEGDYRVGYSSIPVGDASVIQCFLSYDGVTLHHWWVLDPQKQLNPRYAIHEIFDEKLEAVNRFLFKFAENESRTFEDGVALLLNILGFSVSHHGRIPKLQKGPDILAITPTGNIGVIECTVGLLDEKDKLAKLVQRTRLIKEKLVTAGHSHLSVQPVIVTALRRSEIEAHLEEAGKNGIAVVCKENLENLISQINLPPNPDGLFQETIQLVPRVDQPS